MLLAMLSQHSINGGLIGEGIDHTVIKGRSDKYVRKIPKDKLSVADALEGFRFMMDELGKFMPQTRFVIQGDSYIVVQRKVEGRVLNELRDDEINPNIISQLKELLDRVIELNKRHNVGIDLMGPVLKSNSKPNALINSKYMLVRQLYVLIYMRDVLESFNIMVDYNGRIFLVDNVGRKGYFTSIMRKYKNLVLLKLQKSKINSRA